MTAYLDISVLDRRELEDLLLTSHSAYVRTLAAVRSTTGSAWKVRREVEKIAEEVRDRRVFTRAFARLGDVRDARAIQAANDRLWGSLPEPARP